ncbi:hypothetical protein SEA_DANIELLEIGNACE_45 [Arthrobacter phage DanielleIgnace]|nr:hypothetical protein SEA_DANIELLEIGNACE_45 [Arthrobacter phage DanielleIgnace]
MSKIDVAGGERTLYPVDQFTQQVLTKFEDDPSCRALVKLEDPSLTDAEDWVATTDLITGRAIQVRSADCGLGCHCAGEVTLA